MKAFLKQNRTGLTVLACTFALGFAAFLASGCQMTDFVSVDVPAQVQKATGSAARVTLTEAPVVMADYVMYGDRMAASIDRANVQLAWLASAFDIGVRTGGSMLPGGGIAAILLTGLGGLLIKGPGTAKEKEKSYAKGKADAEAILLPLASLAKSMKVDVS